MILVFTTIDGVKTCPANSSTFLSSLRRVLINIFESGALATQKIIDKFSTVMTIVIATLFLTRSMVPTRQFSYLWSKAFEGSTKIAQESPTKLAKDPLWTRIKLDVLLQASYDGAEIIVVP